MITLRFKRWNWQFDHGVEELEPDHGTPHSYCEATIDSLGRLCRVVIKVQGLDGFHHVATVYDYFCNSDQQVLQKRSYGEKDTIDLIVDYHLDGDWVVETARTLEDSEVRSVRRRVNWRPNYGSTRLLS